MSAEDKLTKSKLKPVSRNYANDLREQIEWIDRLVAFDTTSRNSNLALIEVVESYFADNNVPCSRIESPDGSKANLLAVVGPHERGGVVLSAHTDVVPVDGQEWHTDPWSLTEKDGRLYGRGTCDMKSFAAIALSLVPEMLIAKLKYPIIFALSYDEEVGCLGAPSMISRLHETVPKPMAVIVGEPTSMNVVDTHKGFRAFRTSVRGRASHSSQTNLGVSAVEAAARLIEKIALLRDARAACADPASSFVPPHTTMTVNTIRGGTQLNIMAEHCSFEWDMRTMPGESPEVVKEEIEACARTLEAEMQARASGCSIATEQRVCVPHLRAEDSGGAVELAKILTGNTQTRAVPYVTEAGQFQEAGYSSVVCGPGSIDQAHQANEFISLQQVAKGTGFLRSLIQHLASD